MNVEGTLNRNAVGREIRSAYFNGLISTSTFETMQFLSDDQFVRPIQEAARLYSASTPVYFYRFSHEGGLFGVRNRAFSGVGHTEDLGYLFDFKHTGTEEDYLTRERMARMWTNFAKTGNPTPESDPLLGGIVWEPNTGGGVDLKSLEINSTLQMTLNPNEEKMRFWRRLYEENASPPHDTY